MITVVPSTWWWPNLAHVTFPHIMEHLEKCGRVCYKSEDRITEGSAETLISALCRTGHESVLEHVTLTAHIQCSRACSHQLVRHRLAAYSQESMRYCNYGKRGLQVICPPSIGIEPGEYQWATPYHDMEPSMEPLTFRQRRWVASNEQSYNEYLEELEEGILPEDARFSLPIATKTEVVATYNLRMWRHLFRERAFNKHAQWEIRNTFTEIYNDLVQRLPAVFGDLKETT